MVVIVVRSIMLDKKCVFGLFGLFGLFGARLDSQC